MEEFEGRWASPRWLRGLYLVGLPVVLFAQFARSFTAVELLVLWVLLGVNTMRGPVRVTRDVVSVPRTIPPWRTRIGWDEVKAVKTPNRWDTATTLLLADGSVVELRGVGPEHSGTIAGIGHKPLQERSTTSGRRRFRWI